MKKVKIMLLSLALIAVVGGALAFKVKIGSTKFCTGTVYVTAGGNTCSIPDPDFPSQRLTIQCQAAYDLTSATLGNQFVICTTPTNNSANCGQLECTTSASSIVAE